MDQFPFVVPKGVDHFTTSVAFSKEMLIKHFTYLFTPFAFASIVVLCLADFLLLFLHFFSQLGAAMKLLQKRKEYTSLQQ